MPLFQKLEEHILPPTTNKAWFIKMPRTGPKNDPGLSIELKNPKASYRAGDRLSGSVHVKPPAKLEFGHVRIILCGRTKTKISRTQAHQTKIYRGRRVFFERSYTLYTSEKAGSQTQKGGTRGPLISRFPPHRHLAPATNTSRSLDFCLLRVEK